MRKNSKIIIFIIWIIVIFYLDPGGFIYEIVKETAGQKIFYFAVTTIALLIYFFNYNKYEILENKYIWYYIAVLIIWYSYYFIWFYGLNNANFPGLLRTISRNSEVITQSLIVFPIIYFASIELKHFTKLLIWSTIIIISAFILTTIFHLNLMPVMEMKRFQNLNIMRFTMYGYGIVYILIPMAIAMVMLRMPIERKIIVASFFVIVMIMITMWRRDMVAIVEHFIIISFLINYIYGGKIVNFLKRVFNTKIILSLFLITIIVVSIFPKLLTDSQLFLTKTYDSLFVNDKDVRLSLTGKTSIVDAIKENPITGTGYSSDWWQGNGGEKDWEGADYIFLACFAMYGLLGLALFLPFYFLVIGIIVKLLKLLRQNLELIYKNKAVFYYPLIISIAVSSEFIRNMIEYPNWFYPIAANPWSARYFIYFGLLLGSYYFIQRNIFLLSKMEIPFINNEMDLVESKI